MHPGLAVELGCLLFLLLLGCGLVREDCKKNASINGNNGNKLTVAIKINGQLHNTGLIC